MNVYTLQDKIELEKFGGKAHWLKWLYDHEARIPDTVFIPACTLDEIQSLVKNAEFVQELTDKISRLDGKFGFAVRSSSLSEDGRKESKAGNFSSFLSVKGIENILDAIVGVVKSNKNNQFDKMGVVVQSMVNTDVSGVIFSSNPVTASKKEVLISAIAGHGDALVSGLKSSIDLCVELRDDGWKIPKNGTGIKNAKIKELVNFAKNIENALQLPVDIEWCYVKETDTIVIVQCRPITTIFVENGIYKISNASMENVSKKFINSDKIHLRLFAEYNNVKISDGYLVTCNCITDDIPLNDFNLERSEDYRGYSVVILYPSKISQKVIRSFIGDKYNVSKVSRCQRYGVRSLPDYENLASCLQSFYQKVKEESWICSIIVQEIYDPLYTGIIKKTNDGYIVEFAKGHFVSKGVVPMSTYMLDMNGEIKFANEVRQYRHIGIIEGCTLEYGCSDDEDSSLVSLPADAVSDIVNCFRRILNEDGITVEFGVLQNDQHYTPYLIDCISETQVDNINLNSFASGVISEGVLTGKVMKLEVGDFHDSLNLHFYNDIGENYSASTEKIIFYADLPSIKFIDILSKYPPEDIAFVFRDGSLLCHLSVLLREKGIPAIVGVSATEIEEGAEYRLDTSAKSKLTKV